MTASAEPSPVPERRPGRAGAALGRTRATTVKGLRRLATPAGVRGAAREVAWVATHVASYPAGLLAEKGVRAVDRMRLDDLTPVQRGLIHTAVEAADTPILLVHGMVDNRSVFTVLRRSLRRRGFSSVTTLNYSVFVHDVAAGARRLADHVERICAETGYERIHVVGHSLGGLIARWYVQKLGGDARVHTLVTLGTPHEGTGMARLLPLHLARELRPGSDVVRALAEPAPGCRTRFVAFWSDLDQMIVPKRSARISHPDLRARNVFLRGVGHLSLPIDRTVVHEIATTLAHLDHEGHPVHADVTPLPAETEGGRRDPRPIAPPRRLRRARLGRRHSS